MTKPLTLARYFASFRTSVTALAGLGIAPALLGNLKSTWAAYLFPTLGDFDFIARIGTVLLSFLILSCGYLMVGSKYIRINVVVGVLLTAISLPLYILVSAEYVRNVSIPSEGLTVLISVGHTRTEYALKEFPSENDYELLRARGLSDEEVYRLWTRSSVLTGRMLLLGTYLGLVLGWTYALSAFMALELSRKDEIAFKQENSPSATATSRRTRRR